jgi:hypothetical protein
MGTCARSSRAASRRSPRPRKRTARAESTSVSTGCSTRPQVSPWAGAWRITCSRTRLCRCAGRTARSELSAQPMPFISLGRVSDERAANSSSHHSTHAAWAMPPLVSDYGGLFFSYCHTSLFLLATLLIREARGDVFSRLLGVFKGARPVWSGGKAERPYLSLPQVLIGLRQ